MARRRRDGGPEWGQLYELAESQEGYVTTAQAHEAGYSNPLLHHHVRRGRLDRVARGIYRLRHFPAGDHEEFVVAWLWSGHEGVFSHESALALHELSDALPNWLHLTVPSGWSSRRLRVPDGVRLHYSDVPHADWSWVGPVPVTKPLRTIRDCLTGHVAPDLVQQAIEDGVQRGFLARRDVSKALRTRRQ